ncbi:putative ribonucleoside-diphosphate reductase large chain [Polyporus arcularius HHB13444]|uniref:Ribonucleoside-diphosphate reductase n=1 Tax=Polyporus arcularius HHB13444 TaxID=1314778 RepID=A0A5C3PE30_9APHY|nr:putative ribonucleoside-diphosphate reductase large chain [Polyporus arcularius HHB13444]
MPKDTYANARLFLVHTRNREWVRIFHGFQRSNSFQHYLHSLERFAYDKILSTLKQLSFGLDGKHVSPDLVALSVDRSKKHEMTTDAILSLAARCAADLGNQHPDYMILAGRLEVRKLHRNVKPSFVETMVDIDLDDPQLLDPDFLKAVKKYGHALDTALRHDRDDRISYPGFKTMASMYFITKQDRGRERPQHLWMRVAVHIHRNNLTRALETYDLLSRGLYSHASPTLFNAGLRIHQLSSCFVQTVDCSTPCSPFSSVHDASKIFMQNGGLGLDLHNSQPGVISLLEMFDAAANYASRNQSKRPSAATATLPIWHADTPYFIEIHDHRDVSNRDFPNLHLALFVPDLFMDRVQEDGIWSMFDPLDVPTLSGLHGDAFVSEYLRAERELCAIYVASARDLWLRIIQLQIEGGEPFILYSDSINAKNNQRHIGPVYSTNLCTEIVQHTSSTHTAVCTLASIVLPSFATETAFDLQELHRVVKIVVRNTDSVIDLNHYPTAAACYSAKQTRAIGVGVIGLADVFHILGFPYDSPTARLLSRSIAETIYHAALEASTELAAEKGPYPSYEGSPAQQQILQYDMWDTVPSSINDFAALKARVRLYGLRNSMLTAQMPTATTSQVTGYNESTDPYISNCYTRRALGGEFQITCPTLVRDLSRAGLWTTEIRRKIIRAHGSIQDIEDIPSRLKDIYRTAWEIPQRVLLDLAIERAPFIDQSQSTTVYMRAPTISQVHSMHMYGWKGGLKTGMYYLRTSAAAYPTPPFEYIDDIERDDEDGDGQRTPKSATLCGESPTQSPPTSRACSACEL